MGKVMFTPVQLEALALFALGDAAPEGVETQGGQSPVACIVTPEEGIKVYRQDGGPEQSAFLHSTGDWSNSPEQLDATDAQRIYGESFRP